LEDLGKGSYTILVFNKGKKKNNNEQNKGGKRGKGDRGKI